jgi:hypothetical protein
MNKSDVYKKQTTTFLSHTCKVAYITSTAWNIYKDTAGKFHIRILAKIIDVAVVSYLHQDCNYF